MKVTYNVNNKMPSVWSKLPLVKKNQSRRVDINPKVISVSKMAIFMTRGDNNNEVPSTSVRLVRQEPMTLPRARLVYPFFTAVSDTDNSGREVPMAIMVAPIMDFDIFNASAMLDAELTAKFELRIIPINPKMRDITVV